MRFIILLISISFMASCTVQKRVHRKGWHVEWKKNYRTDHSENEPKIAFEEETIPSSIHLEYRNQTETQSSINEESTANDETIELNQKPPHSDNPEIVSRLFVESEETENAESEPKDVVSSSDQATNTASRTAGIAILILSLFFIGLAILFLVLSFSTIEPVAAIVYIGAAGILGVIGFVFLIIGFSLFLIRGVAKNEERIHTAAETKNTEPSDWESQSPPPETKPNNEKPSDEKPKNALISSIALIAVAVLVTIYFLTQK